MLTARQIEQYHEDGYVVPDYRFPHETVAAIRAHHSRFLKRHPQYTDYCPAMYIHDDSFLQYALNTTVLDMVEQLIGPNIAIWNSSFFAKPAQVGTRTPWHQDGEYWPIRPLATCSVWLAVDDSTEENGCLQFVPGSHKSRTLSNHHVNNGTGLALPLELDENTFDEDNAVCLELEAGQFSLHDVFLMHASDPNRSSHPRRGMTMRYMPTKSVFRRDLTVGAARGIDEERPIYLLRGIDESGRNQFIAPPNFAS